MCSSDLVAAVQTEAALNIATVNSVWNEDFFIMFQELFFTPRGNQPMFHIKHGIYGKVYFAARASQAAIRRFPERRSPDRLDPAANPAEQEFGAPVLQRFNPRLDWLA